MRTDIISLTIASRLSMTAYTDLTGDQLIVRVGVAGPTVDIPTADTFGANDNWKIPAELGGAVAGTLVARKELRFSNGAATYHTANCP